MDKSLPLLPATCAICEEKPSEILHTTEYSLLVWGAGSFGEATRMGHVMVCPRRHVAQIGDLEAPEVLDLIRCSALAARVAYSSFYKAGSWPVHLYGPKSSYNLGFNSGPDGEDAIPGNGGQGHLHVHVVPRNLNDTNFMWWTTRSAVLHLHDMGIKEKMIEELQQRTLRVDSPVQPSPSSSDDPKEQFEPDFDATEPRENVCPLCKETNDLMELPLARVLFSVKPYKVGHVMVIPRRHVSNLEHCTDEEVQELFRLVSIAAKVSCAAVGSESYSVGINVGPHSGASIPSHLHIHVVPRFPLDSAVSFWPRAEACLGALFAPPQVREAFQRDPAARGSSHPEAEKL